jgi:hypothetical protein
MNQEIKVNLYFVLIGLCLGILITAVVIQTQFNVFLEEKSNELAALKCNSMALSVKVFPTDFNISLQYTNIDNNQT